MDADFTSIIWFDQHRVGAVQSNSAAVGPVFRFGKSNSNFGYRPRLPRRSRIEMMATGWFPQLFDGIRFLCVFSWKEQRAHFQKLSLLSERWIKICSMYKSGLFLNFLSPYILLVSLWLGLDLRSSIFDHHACLSWQQNEEPSYVTTSNHIVSKPVIVSFRVQIGTAWLRYQIT